MEALQIQIHLLQIVLQGENNVRLLRWEMVIKAAFSFLLTSVPFRERRTRKSSSIRPKSCRVDV